MEVARSAWAVFLYVLEYEETRSTTHLWLMRFCQPGRGFLCAGLTHFWERSVHLDLVRGVVKTVLLGAGVSQHAAHVCC